LSAALSSVDYLFDAFVTIFGEGGDSILAYTEDPEAALLLVHVD
jgi:hypothetical protein